MILFIIEKLYKYKEEENLKIYSFFVFKRGTIFMKTKGGVTHCLAIQSITDCALADESMVILDPMKGELTEYISGRLKQLGYNVVTLYSKNPEKLSSSNLLPSVINESKKDNLAKEKIKVSDICESIVDESKDKKI